VEARNETRKWWHGR